MEHPFVYVDDVPVNGSCSDLNTGNKKFVECSGTIVDEHFEHSKENGVHCCSGKYICLKKILILELLSTYLVEHACSRM